MIKLVMKQAEPREATAAEHELNQKEGKRGSKGDNINIYFRHEWHDIKTMITISTSAWVWWYKDDATKVEKEADKPALQASTASYN